MDLTRTQAIANFLNKFGIPDLAQLYNYNMECQVNVAQDGGRPIEGEYKGRRWRAWTDGVSNWKPFRVPFNAAKEATYEDSKMTFDFAGHVEGIGMTGWDWKNRKSKWVAFDFDAVVGHSKSHDKKLTDEELKQIIESVKNVPWITLRKSTSGKGLHMYVFLNDVPTENHTEHAALARAILAKLSAFVGFDFISKVDICGGNMWVWHRKQKGTDGLSLIKTGVKLDELPANWKDHVKVCKGLKKRVSMPLVEGAAEDKLDELSGSNQHIPLDATHKKLIDWLQKSQAVWWWDPDRHMLVTHTLRLKEAHTELQLKGIFDTISRGSSEQNCYMFPMRNGAWNVRRFSPGCAEHASWTQDSAGWTRCFYNREADLETAARAGGGLELPDNKGYHFAQSESAAKTLLDLGANIGEIPPHIRLRPAIVREQKDGRLVVTIDAQENEQMPGWSNIKNKWTRVVNAPHVSTQETDIQNCDEYLRHIVSDHDRKDAGWVVLCDNHWQEEPLAHIRPLLKAQGTVLGEVDLVIGSCITRSWRIVSKPFQSEYPGNREWNRMAAKLRFIPTKDAEELKYPNWMKIFKHLGKNLDDSVKMHPWCQANGIQTGAEYLLLWVASMFQEPLQPLPYLFLFGPEDCGKSVLAEALQLLMINGSCKVDTALKDERGFNGEMLGAVLCIVEETNLKTSKDAYSRLKEWVTGRMISLHTKGDTPYQVRNCAHFIQTANNHDYCPMFPGDTRITVIRVDSIDPMDMIPKEKLFNLLEAEASDFLGYVTTVEIPEPISRLNIPVVETVDKFNITRNNETLLEKFIREHCFEWPGNKLVYAEFKEAFVEWLPTEERPYWTPIKISKQFPVKYPKGAITDNVTAIGNLALKKPPEGFKPVFKLTLNPKGYLVETPI